MRKRGAASEGEILISYGELIADAKRQYPNAKVVVAGLPPRGAAADYYRRQANLNRQLRQLALDKGAHYVFPAPVELPGAVRMKAHHRMYREDLLHFTTKGKRVYCQNLVEVLSNFACPPVQPVQ